MVKPTFLRPVFLFCGCGDDSCLPVYAPIVTASALAWPYLTLNIENAPSVELGDWL
jgi:hypothetical protein